MKTYKLERKAKLKINQLIRKHARKNKQATQERGINNEGITFSHWETRQGINYQGATHWL